MSAGIMPGRFIWEEKMQLLFKSIKNGTIFEPDFQNLENERGTISFKHLHTTGGIAVVYAPNGTGKSSFTKVLSADKATSEVAFLAETDDRVGGVLTPESNAFHIIPDQINRNVIRGKETDYLIGQQIRREYELREQINAAFTDAYSFLTGKYKSDYNVSKVGDFLLSQVSVHEGKSFVTAYKFIRSIVNPRSHGKDIAQVDYVDYIRDESQKPVVEECDKDKKNWIISDASGKNKITELILNLNNQDIKPNFETIQIKRDDDAIGVLRKYHAMDTCIVCDNHDFHGDELLA